MILTIEGKKYELKANGSFMLRYTRLFKTNFILDLYKALNEKNVLLTAQLLYAAITPPLEETFEEWLDSFETPLFLITESENVLTYIMRETEPKEKSSKKKGKGTEKA